MSEESIFLDESGDFGSNSKYYLVTLVFHNQDNPIDEALMKLNAELGDWKIDLDPLVKRLTVYKKYLRPGHEALSAAEGIAVEANTRLKKKHDALKKAGKHTNTAKVAVVGELVRWMWAIGLQVQRGQAAA